MRNLFNSHRHYDAIFIFDNIHLSFESQYDDDYDDYDEDDKDEEDVDDDDDDDDDDDYERW